MTKPCYRITFFIQEDPAVMFPLLLPFHFKWTERNSITWGKEDTCFQLIPFATRGRESMGYRLLFTGNPDTFVYLADQFLGTFSPVYSGIEWIYETGDSQTNLIQMAEQAGYIRCSLEGIYEYKKIGIVLLKNGDINIQIRNRTINSRNLASFMYDIETIANVFQPKKIDLFSFLDDGVEAS